jgi:hypothetical protein
MHITMAKAPIVVMIVVLLVVAMCVFMMHSRSEGFVTPGWLAEFGDFVETTLPGSAVLSTMDFDKDNPVLVTINDGEQRLAVVGSEVKLTSPPTGADVLKGVWALVPENGWYCLRNAFNGMYFVCEDTRCVKQYATWKFGNANVSAPGNYHLISRTCFDKELLYLNSFPNKTIELAEKATTEWTLKVYAIRPPKTTAPTTRPTTQPTMTPKPTRLALVSR